MRIMPPEKRLALAAFLRLISGGISPRRALLEAAAWLDLDAWVNSATPVLRTKVREPFAEGLDWYLHGFGREENGTALHWLGWDFGRTVLGAEGISDSWTHVAVDELVAGWFDGDYDEVISGDERTDRRPGGSPGGSAG